MVKGLEGHAAAQRGRVAKELWRDVPGFFSLFAISIYIGNSIWGKVFHTETEICYDTVRNKCQVTGQCAQRDRDSEKEREVHGRLEQTP